MKHLLQDFLNNAKDIAQGKIPNMLTNVAICSSSSYYENLGMFINLSNENITKLHSGIEKKCQMQRNNMEFIWAIDYGLRAL